MKPNQETRMRLTENQKYLGECMRCLIDLFYEEEFSKPVKEWAIGNLTGGLIRFFTSVFGQCTYDQDSRNYKATYDDSDEELTDNIFKMKFSNNITVDKSQLATYVEVMNSLHSAVLSGDKTHFLLKKEWNSVENSLARMEQTSGAHIGFIDESDDPTRMEFSKAGGWKNVRKTINKTETVARRIQHRCSYADDDLVVVSSNTQIFEVDALTEFAQKVLNMEPKETGITSAQSLKLVRKLTFEKIVKSVIVNFHVDFDNFERIKVCEYSGCRRLIYEKKYGALKFCNKNCRKKHFEEGEALEKRRCRDRQNAWIKRQVNENKKLQDVKDGEKEKSFRPYVLYKSDCTTCIITHQGGGCPALRVRNSDAFEYLDQDG